ncbi:MAG: DNA-deoxyinosine glycosylase [Victivallales bacterium]|nr:DNA-deoxyinosine glycosylase [Victivallales bacterium]
MTYCESFAPVWQKDAKILILGSMPGVESLRQQQYYAFRHNVFWRIMGELFHFDANLPYPERLECLMQNHLALWDVLGQCERQGSLDTAIQHAIPNDIPGLLKKCPKITRILCNGTAAATHFRHNFPQYIPMMTRLPSTSPAAARLRFEQKLLAWRQAIRP